MILEQINSEQKVYDLLMEAETSSGKSGNFKLLEGVSFDAHQLSNEMGESNDKRYFTKLHRGILSIAFLISLTHIIAMGYWIGILGVATTLFFHVRSKFMIRNAVKMVNAEKPIMEKMVFLERQHISSYLNYLSQGIFLKETRVQVLQMELSFLLPITFMCGTEIILSRVGIIEMVFALVIGLLTWFFVFQNDYEKIYDFQDRLEDMEEKISSL